MTFYANLLMKYGTYKLQDVSTVPTVSIDLSVKISKNYFNFCVIYKTKK